VNFEVIATLVIVAAVLGLLTLTTIATDIVLAAAMIVAATMEVVPLFEASFLAAGLMVATGCLTLRLARDSIEYPVIVGIAASVALGAALTESGAAGMIATAIGALSGTDPFWAPCVLYAVPEPEQNRGQVRFTQIPNLAHKK